MMNLLGERAARTSTVLVGGMIVGLCDVNRSRPASSAEFRLSGECLCTDPISHVSCAAAYSLVTPALSAAVLRAWGRAHGTRICLRYSIA